MVYLAHPSSARRPASRLCCVWLGLSKESTKRSLSVLRPGRNGLSRHSALGRYFFFAFLAGVVSYGFVSCRTFLAVSQREIFGRFPLRDEGDELVELARALNETACRLDESIRTLSDERNQSAAILSSMSEGVVVVGPDERIVFCNQAFQRAVLDLPDTQCEGRLLVEVTRQADLIDLIHQALCRR